MGVDELKAYKEFTVPISDDYLNKVLTLKNKDTLSECRECINYMIENKVKLEQEALLIK